MNKKLNSITRDVGYRAQQTRGTAKQTAGAATGNSRRQSHHNAIRP